MKKTTLSFLLVAAVCTGAFTFATETEHLGMQVLPAPAKVVIDGKFDDWDLTGGILACGDTVDLQLGTDPAADPKRTEPVNGDLRLSIGNFQGQPTAAGYRKVADEKPKTFSSGVVKEYLMDSVVVLAEAKVAAKVDAQGKRYVVEAAIPLAALGLKLTDGRALRGDFGATHGDKSGKDTMLRSHWNNQTTGIVNDEVFELRMEPANWGELEFRN